LRLLVSGGAKLDETSEDRLEALGWTVLTGYGLAETASLFTGNGPEARKRGSTGRPLAGGQIRIANPDETGIGEIELRGPSIVAGYLDNPEANRAGFSPDGWFRTGDLGHIDRDGFLFVTGRAKEILVLGGSKKIDPEYLERIYGGAPQIREIAVLVNGGALVALVRPDPAKLREMGSTNLRDGVRVVLGVAAQRLPPYQRLSGFALTDQPLPRTRLGKYRRFLLPDLYARALAGGVQRAAHAVSKEDSVLLGNPTARSVWQLLQQRYPTGAIDLDVNLALDLNLDSFAWMELTIAVQDRVGIRLTENDIAGIETMRDLLRICARSAGSTGRQEWAIAEDIDRWLAPTGLVLTVVGLLLYWVNRFVMRRLFRLRVAGLENLPESGPCLITPNHVSDLDALAIAAAIPISRMYRVYWAGDIVRLFFSAWTRFLCRAAHLFPVDETHPGAAVRAAVRVLQAGNTQVWFPEGWRSPDGRLQRFLPGVGEVLLHAKVPAVPVWIGGAFEALPRGSHVPKFRQVTLNFGRPIAPERLISEGAGRTEEERIAEGLRRKVIELAEATGHVVEELAA
jgi:long-chain acyl-CoA synthetase